jgi:hypothetical protein
VFCQHSIKMNWIFEASLTPKLTYETLIFNIIPISVLLTILKIIFKILCNETNPSSQNVPIDNKLPLLRTGTSYKPLSRPVKYFII